MSDIQLNSGTDTENETAEILADSLPTDFPKHADSNNYQLFGAIAEEIDELGVEIERVHRATRVSEAETIEELAEIAKIVGLVPKQGEGLEHYRARTLATFQNITSEGTISDILESSGYILGVSTEKISYIEDEEPGLIVLGLPKTAIDDAPLSSAEIVDLLEDNVAVGKTLQSLVTGTLAYISVEDSNSNLDDPEAGYAGLDTDGNVTSGGTYSTTLE